MNITVRKILRELKNKHGWENLDIENEELIKHIIDVINDELIKHKNIRIKK